MLDPRGLDHTRRRLICPHDRPTVRRARNDSADGVLAQRDARATADAAPAPLRIAHGISALGIIDLPGATPRESPSFILGPDTYRTAMKAMRHLYRQEFLQPLLVALFLFQVGSGVYLAAHSVVRTIDRFRTFQIARGIFLAAYLLGHMSGSISASTATGPSPRRRPVWLRTPGNSPDDLRVVAPRRRSARADAVTRRGPALG